MSIITITAHDQREWARMAKAAYARGLTTMGDRYHDASKLPRIPMDTRTFDRLQEPYRNWLVFNEMPN